MAASSDDSSTDKSGEMIELPLFPLRTVLFQGGILPLRIFEPRYVDMVRWCMRQSSPFVVVLLRSGNDVMTSGEELSDQGEAKRPDIFRLGTLANIVDFNQADNGLLGIVAQGDSKALLHDTWLQKDGLLMGRAEVLPEETEVELDSSHSQLISVLSELMKHPLIQQLKPDVDLASALSVSYRLSELLPIEPEIKQALLQMNGPTERLNELSRIVAKFCE